MKYQLTGNYRVDFTARAPMHTFKGQTRKGVEAFIDIDFDTLTLRHARASADVDFFTTPDHDRTTAMKTYIMPEKFPTASIETTHCRSFEKVSANRFRLSVLAVLEFMGTRRQMPVSFIAKTDQSVMTIEIAFKWSFKAYGLKAPRLLFLTVRDIVDIKGTGEFSLVNG